MREKKVKPVNQQDRIEKIAAKIENFLNIGLEAGEDVLHYARSALGIETVEEVGELLCDEELYGDGIIDLFFFPNESLRLDVEPLVPPEGLSQEAEENLWRCLHEKISTVNVGFVNDSYRTTIPLPGPILRNFIAQLKPGKKMHPGLYEGFITSEEKEKSIGARVRVRNSAYLSTPEREEFLLRMLQSLIRENRVSEEEAAFFPDAGTLLYEALDFMLKLFTETRTNKDIQDMIIQKRRFWEDSLKTADRFDREYGKLSPEFFMMQKLTPPVVNEEKAQKNICLADLIINLI
ncbi:MAG: hypothetical protein GY754_31830 [bacterium]|nr:hypothetical protein [bacterium]